MYLQYLSILRVRVDDGELSPLAKFSTPCILHLQHQGLIKSLYPSFWPKVVFAIKMYKILHFYLKIENIFCTDPTPLILPASLPLPTAHLFTPCYFRSTRTVNMNLLCTVRDKCHVWCMSALYLWIHTRIHATVNVPQLHVDTADDTEGLLRRAAGVTVAACSW